MVKFMAAFCFAALSLFAIEGTYSLTGYDPYEKKPYTGSVIITKDKNSVYQAVWTLKMNNRDLSATGTGIRTNNDISFVYEEPSGTYGLQIYKITGTHLEGPFVQLDGNLVGTEKLDKQSGTFNP